MKRCCFAGHNESYGNDVKEKIRNVAINLIENSGVIEFWVGNYGRFDRCCATVIREVKKIYPDIKLVLILPYLTKEINDNKSYYKGYDYIVIADIAVTTPARYRIIKANQYMIDNCDYLICNVTHSWGGAYKTLEYARKKTDVVIFNVAK